MLTTIARMASVTKVSIRVKPYWVRIVVFAGLESQAWGMTVGWNSVRQISGRNGKVSGQGVQAQRSLSRRFATSIRPALFRTSRARGSVPWQRMKLPFKASVTPLFKNVR